MAKGNFTIAGEDDVMFNVISRMWRRNAFMTAVVSTAGVSRINGDVVGVIIREYVADSAADSVRPYGTGKVTGAPRENIVGVGTALISN